MDLGFGPTSGDGHYREVLVDAGVDGQSRLSPSPSPCSDFPGGSMLCAVHFESSIALACCFPM